MDKKCVWKGSRDIVTDKGNGMGGNTLEAAVQAPTFLMVTKLI